MAYRNSYSNHKTLYSVLILVCVVGFWLFENYYAPDPYSNPKRDGIHYHLPEYVIPSSTTGQLVSHDFFMLSYNEVFEQAEWVAYGLKKKHLTYDERDRPYFIEDPEVKTKSADWRNYRGSGYDRGHLCPAGDRRFSEYAYNETFYTSNVSPQDRNFNAGVWNRLEMKVRQWAKRYDEVFVITAGVLESGLEEIGQEGVDVPKRYYKIVARGEKQHLRILGFLMNGRESTKPLSTFAVPIDMIELRTGIDFFEKLSDSRQQKLESEVDLTGWAF